MRNGSISIHHDASEFQLGDMLTRPQPEALFVAQRESITHWNAEHCSAEELLLIPSHLRECGIKDINGDQNARSQQDSGIPENPSVDHPIEETNTYHSKQVGAVVHHEDTS